MSGLSQNLSEQKYGRRTVHFSLRDGVLAMPSSDDNANADNADQYDLKLYDGTACAVDVSKWHIHCHPGDTITQVLLSTNKGKHSTLAAVINRTQRERQRVEPLQVLLRKTRISRSFSWWVSFIFLTIAAVVTEQGFFARWLAALLSLIENRLFEPLRPLMQIVSEPVNTAFRWLPMPAWTVKTSASFGSLQDHSAVLYVAVILLVLILWSRTLRPLTVPLFVLLLFILKTRLFGFGGAHGAVLCWYAPVLVLMVFTGLINRYRDRWRLAVRLSAICKSQVAQPPQQSPAPEETPTNEEVFFAPKPPALRAANSP